MPYLMRLVNIGKLNARGVRLAQRQFIAARAYFKRIAQRRGLDHGHFRAGRQPHIQYVLAQRNLIAVYAVYDRVLARRKTVKRHLIRSFPCSHPFYHLS